jgi:type IV secretion system protein VirB10
MTKLFHLAAAAGSIIILGLAAPILAQQAAPPPVPQSQTQTQTQTGPPSSAAPAQQSAAASDVGKADAPAPAALPASAPADQPTPVVQAAPAVPAKIELPTGTHIPLVLHNAVSTRSAQPGDPVYFETSFPVMLNGKVVVPAGSWVSGEVTEAKRPGRVKGRAELMVRLNTLILPNAYMISLAASPGNAGTGGNETTDHEGKIKGDTDKGADVGTVMKTTAAGAGIGGLAAQSAKGAGIGAGVGAAVGLATVLLTRGPEAELPRGTTLDAILDHPILLDADKVQFSSPGQASALPGPPNREPVRNKSPF